MKLFKQLFSVLIITVLLLTGCSSSGTSASGSSNSKVSPADVKFVEKTVNNIVIQVPSDWKVSDEDDGIQFYPPESNDIIVLITQDAGTNLSGYEDVAFQSFESSFTAEITDYTVEDQKIDGHPGKLLQFSEKAASGIEFKFNVYAFVNQNYLYAFMIGVDDTAERSYRPIYGYIIDTIKYIDDSSSEVKEETQQQTQTSEPEEEVPREYKNALKKAENYANFMNMSKQGIYDQLVSEYGENFPEDAAQYAVDHLNADFNKNALEKAKSYSDMMNMSEAGIYDQLTSEYGEQFTPEEAQYAIEHLDADYNYNALQKAISYSELMSMSDSEIYDQLVSEYGEKFTPEQAQYAIDHLDD